MKRFLEALAAASRPVGKPRTWVYAPYDQLSDRQGPLRQLAPEQVGLVLIESRAKAQRRPYHRQKLAWVLTNQRHFALEQAQLGVTVRYCTSAGSYASVLEPLTHELGPILVQRPAERELRMELRELIAQGRLVEIPHEGWLSNAADFAALGDPPWRMDRFYKSVRQRTGILMEGTAPLGGRYSFDTLNRQPWKGAPQPPQMPQFVPDAITTEVCELIEEQYASHPGTLNPAALPASQADALRQWEWAQRECLPHFGPYEDAMSRTHANLFHTAIAPLLNLQRLSAQQVIEDAVRLPLPIASKEGFVRQILGWREFVRHVHEATDGLRSYRGRALERNHLQATAALPPAYWQANSGLACLDSVVESVWERASSHHITRLMILGNIATLLEVEPQQLSDWFWIAYADAYEWVVEPNVMAMATYGMGELMTTKPYVSGAAYIERMSDYCQSCAFDPKRDCPLTALYWEFIGRHAEEWRSNPRMAMPVRSWMRRSPAQRARDQRVAQRTKARLARGERLDPHLGFEA